MTVTLAAPLLSLTGVGPRRSADLEQAGLRTVGDLLARFPIRYEDRARLREIASLGAGERATVAGTVVSCGTRLTRRAGFKLFEAVVGDATGTVKAVWLNQPFMASVVSRGASIILYGPAERRDTWPAQLEQVRPIHGELRLPGYPLRVVRGMGNLDHQAGR